MGVYEPLGVLAPLNLEPLGVLGVLFNGSMRPVEEIHILLLEFDETFLYFLLTHVFLLSIRGSFCSGDVLFD